MAKRYFGSKKASEPSLGKIILILTVLLCFGYAGLWAWSRMGGRAPVAPPPEETARLLEAARDLAASEQWEAARERLDALPADGLAPEMAVSAFLLRAEVTEKMGDAQGALSILADCQARYGDTAQKHVIATQYGEALRRAGRESEAREVFSAMLESAPPGQRAPALLDMAKNLEKESKLSDARLRYREALADAAPASEIWLQAAQGLGRVNTGLIFSTGATTESKVYTVKSGDNLTDIGIKLNTTQGLLMQANDMADPSKLSIGQQLKYTPKDFRVVIERATCRIYVLDKNGLFKLYFTGLGQPGHETALGNFTVGNKIKNPTWFPAGKPSVPPLDPANELGTRWIPLVPAQEGLPADLGIHGTIQPDSIGQYMSLGCPRMHKEDVEELYDLIVRSTPVSIVETHAWNDH
jgi:lipoprotein-anchoring transpeptidase ErfK/SrfK